MPIGILEPFDIYPLTAFDASTEGSIGSNWNLGVVSTNVMGFVTGLGGQGKALKWLHRSDTAAQGKVPTIHKNFPTTDKITLCCAIQVPFLNDNGYDAIMFRTDSLARQFGFGFSAANKLVLRGENNATLGTSTFDLQEGQVYRMVSQIDLTTLNSCNITTKINGKQDDGLTKAGIDLHDASVTTVSNLLIQGFAAYVTGPDVDWVIDDLVVIYDELLNLPPIELFTMAPTSDVLAQFTRLTGTSNASNVDDIPFTQDTDYNYDTVVGHKDVLQFGALPRTPEFILAVSALSLTKKDEAALREIRNLLRIGGVDYPDGVNFTQAELYSQYLTHYMVNPATGVPWVAADFPLQGGYELMT